MPLTSVLFQIHELDRLAYRYRFTVYPTEDHIGSVSQDEFDDPVSHMGTGRRQGDPGHITFTWFPQLVRNDLGIGPHQVWWLSNLTADPDTTATRGDRLVDARSMRGRTRRAPRGVSWLRTGPRPVTRAVHRAHLADRVGCRPVAFLALHLTRVAGLTVDVTRAGLASLSVSTINVVTDTPAQITLAALPPNTTVLLDGQPTGPTVAVPVGRHTVTLTH